MRGNQNLFSTVAVSAVAVVLLFSAPTIARAFTTNLNAGESINLGTLIANGWSAQVGDKIFGDFGFTYTDHGAPDTDLAATNVNVRALSNDVGFGLEFQEPLFALNTRTKDVTFQYTVEVDTNNYPGFTISDIHLDITGSRTGAGTGSVHEVVFNDNYFGTQIGQVDAWLPSTLHSSNDISPTVVKLWLHKDVMVSGNSGGPGSSASITIIDQTFSQIPEPSTMLLVGLGLLGVVALKRRS